MSTIPTMPTVLVINLNPSVGGGEMYTAFFCQALLELGYPVQLFAHPRAAYYQSLKTRFPQTFSAILVETEAALLQALPTTRSWIVTHAKISVETARALRQRHYLSGFCHMPLFNRGPGVLVDYDLVIPVSNYVLGTMQSHGLKNAYTRPLLGVGSAQARADGSGDIHRQTIIAPDQRILRDRFYGVIEAAARRVLPRQAFKKRAGLSFALISAIGPIKQFDVLFTILAPLLTQHPSIHLEVFGSGSVHSVRKLRRALSPLRARVRFWGFQPNVAALFPHIDYLMTGLPEKEALGLNVLETQAGGVPVLAVNAPPFTETVVDGVTGHLYRDPREDGGSDFAHLLERLVHAANRLDPRLASTHLHTFSQAAFRQRVQALADFVFPHI